MNLRSFRLKIALLSGLITGALLIGFGALLWRTTYMFNLDGLDREIRSVGQGNLDRVYGGDHWERLEAGLHFVSGNKTTSSYVLWVRNYDRPVFRSHDWPASIDPESLPALVRYETEGGPGPAEPPPPPPRRGEEISPRNPALPRKAAQFLTRDAEGRTWRIGIMGNPYTTFVVAADVGEFNGRMVELRDSFVAILPLVLLLAAGGSWWVARHALGPVTALTQAAERVTARGLDQRIPEMSRDQEFNRVITVFNAMLERLEASFRQSNRFSADASHELRTPLARMKVELEQALSRAEPGSAEEQLCSSLLDEVSRLGAVVQKLLLLSQADAGCLVLSRERVDLSRMVGDVIEDTQAQAPGLRIQHSLTPGVVVSADPHLLEQVLQNLAGNAIKYNRPEGLISFELRRQGAVAVLTICNTGPGIRPEDRPRVFERFYRGDPSRSGRVEGTGLGLSLVREILRAHGGSIRLSEGGDGLTCFEADLPAESLPD